MKQLFLIRHGKSNWDSPVDDKSRNLAARGLQDAPIMAERLIPVLPERYMVWSSTAVRAAATMGLFAQNKSFKPDEVILKHELYTFSLSELEKIIKTCADDIDCLLVFGHNEAITDFVNKYGNIPVSNVPTCGIVSISFEDSWKALKHGKTTNFMFPKDKV